MSENKRHIRLLPPELATLGITELDFYREFHQRLNSLVFQYMSEDPKTVVSMLWYGYPVVRYLLAWAVGTGVIAGTSAPTLAPRKTGTPISPPSFLTII